MCMNVVQCIPQSGLDLNTKPITAISAMLQRMSRTERLIMSSTVLCVCACACVATERQTTSEVSHLLSSVGEHSLLIVEQLGQTKVGDAHVLWPLNCTSSSSSSSSSSSAAAAKDNYCKRLRIFWHCSDHKWAKLTDIVCIIRLIGEQIQSRKT